MTTAALPASSSFQQLVAIPLEQYNQMQSIVNMQQPLGQKLVNLQNTLSSGNLNASQLSLASGNNNQYEQMMRQGLLVDEIKRIKEQMKDDIALGTPKPYRNRALALYNHIAPVIPFNKRGELVLAEGGVNDGDINNPNTPTVIGSRAEDLIQHAVRDRRKQFTPTGWSEFTERLHRHNIPRMMLNRPTIEELQELEQRKQGHEQPSMPLLGKVNKIPKPITPTPRRKRKAPRLSIQVEPPNKQRSRKASSRYPPNTFLTRFNDAADDDSDSF